MWDGCIKILSKESGEELQSKVIPTGVAMIRLIADHNLVLAARDDGNISVHTIDNLDKFEIFEAHDDSVSSLCIDSIDVAKFFSAGMDGNIHLWDISSPLDPVMSISEAHYGPINDIGFQHGGDFVLASVGYDGFVRLWDQRERSNECANLFNVQQRGSCLAWDPLCHDRLWVGTDAGDILSLDCRVGSVADLLPKFSHTSRVRRICANQNKPSVILTASDDTSVAVLRRDAASDVIRIVESQRFVVTRQHTRRLLHFPILIMRAHRLILLRTFSFPTIPFFYFYMCDYLDSTNFLSCVVHRVCVHSDYVTDVAWFDDDAAEPNSTATILSASTDKTIQTSTVTL